MYETDIHIFKYTLNQIYFKSIKSLNISINIYLTYL